MRRNYGFTSRRNLEDHFLFHEDDERGFASLEEYGTMAEAFLDRAVTADVLTCTRNPSGVIVRYHQVTQEFMLLTPEGSIMTYYFLPTQPGEWANNYAYFRRQCQRP